MNPVVSGGNSSIHYFNPRLQKRLSAILEHPMTVVEAPMGYGKTVAVRKFLRSAGFNALWTTVLSAGPDIFWSDFCRNLARAMPDQKTPVEALERLGYPHDPVQTSEAYRLMLDLEFPEKTALVVDDFHLLPVPKGATPTGMGGLCELLARQNEDGVRLVLVSRNIYSGDRDILLLKNLLATVGRDDLTLDESDIARYYRRCGVRLNVDEARQLRERTSGWISALYLHLLHYSKHGADTIPETLDGLMEREVLRPMTAEALELLLAVYPLERFNRAQAETVCKLPNALPLLQELLRVNSFLTYDDTDGAFMPHAVMRDCLARRFDRLPEARRREIYAACGECALADGDALTALRFFHTAEAYERALETLESDLGRDLLTKDTALFKGIFDACSPDLLKRHLSAEFIYTLHAFTSGDMRLFGELLARLGERCAALPEGEPETDARRSDLEFLLSLAAYNDIAAMSRHHRRANELLRKGSTTLFTHTSPWTLGSPSVLFMFHRASGELDREMALMHECMPHYYAFASGHGSGGEHQMEAEALLYRCDFSGAAAAERRSEAFALSGEQSGIVLAALFVRMRLALMSGDYAMSRTILENMRERVRERNEYYYLHTVDLCEGHLMAVLGETTGIAEWLRQGMGGEDRLYAFAGGYYYIVHGGVLLAEERPLEAVGLYSWLLKSGIFERNLLLTIYAHVYLAAANQALRQYEEAASELRRAAELAFPDGVILPFVENWRSLADMETDEAEEANAAMFARIRIVATKWNKNRRGILSRHFSADTPLLTERELELARMAATGMKYREIAERAYLAHGTVKRAFATIYGKLGISSREELLEYLKHAGNSKPLT